MNFVSDGTGSSGLGLTALGSQTISVTGNVYSGQGVWNTNGGGSWTDFSKWTTLGGVPGIDGAPSAGDTALFGAALSAGSATVSLNGASPHVSSLTFSTTAKYTVAQGTGGTLNLDAGAGTATIAVLAGNHAIASPVTLVSAANFTQAAGSSLTISGAIGTVSTSAASSLALSQAGPGLLVLGGGNTYFGPTTVSGGVLSAANPNTLSSNSDMFVGGGSLVVTAGPQTVKSLTIGPAGTLNVSVGNLLTSLNAATFGDGTLNVSNYTLGTTEELIAYGSHANPGSDAFLSFTVDGSNSTGYQLEYQANELEIAPVPNTSMLVPSTSALGFGRVLSTAVGTLPVTVGLSGGTTSTGATAAVFTGGLQGATITSATSSGPGYITASQNWTVNVGLGVGLRAQRHGGDPEHGQQRHWANRHGRPAADRQPARPDRRGCERHGGFETHGQRAGRDRLAGNVARKLPCGRCDQRAGHLRLQLSRRRQRQPQRHRKRQRGGLQRRCGCQWSHARRQSE